MPAVAIHAKLSCHAVHPSPTVAGCEVLADWREGGLALEYRILARAGDILLPAPVHPPVFSDGLWQHTCMEAFIAPTAGEGYREFNFSPSGCWAAYAFHAYRQREEEWEPAAAVAVRCTSAPDGWVLRALIPAGLLPPGPRRLGLSAVIETPAHDLGYLAARHADGKPDFHRSETFCLALTNQPDSDS